jgi:hypothetical protein
MKMDVIVAVVTAIGGSIASAAGLGFWLAGKFQEVKDDGRQRMAAHEAQDNKRHEDNIGKFNRIEIELARLIGKKPNGSVRHT